MSRPSSPELKVRTAVLLAVAALTLGTALGSFTLGTVASTPGESTPTPWYVYAPVLLRSDTVTLPTPVVVPDGIPSWGAPIAVTSADETVWVANPDAGSVTMIDARRLVKIAEIPVGQAPWSLALAPDDHSLYVVDRAAGTLVVIDTASRRVRATIPVGPEPGTLALNPTGSRLYVTLMSAAEVAVLDAHRLTVMARISVEPGPYAIAVTDDGDAQGDDEQVYVTHFYALPRLGGEAGDDSREGRVTVIENGSNTVVDQITLAPDDHGFPNLLAGLTMAANRAWVPHLRSAPDLPNDLTNIVFAAVSALDLDQGIEDVSAHLPLNDQEIFGSPVNNPVAAVPAPDGNMLYVVLAGSNLVEVVDVADPLQPRLVRFLAAGNNPRGMALSSDGGRGYVLSFLSRSVTVLDLDQLRWVGEVPVTSETLAPETLRGKLLFNYAADRRLSQGSWVSCASCHPDGAADSVTWFFPDGPRQTPPLWNAGQTLPWHWSAALDEPQDVEETIQVIQHGLGLAPGADPPLLGAPNAGRSQDLDALAAFITEEIRVPAPPPPEGDQALGRDLFQATGCTVCHGGPAWTASALPGQPGALDPDGNGMVDEVLRNVGTLNTLDLRGETGFDPPSLLGVGVTAPYLHDGTMATLEALLASGHPEPQGTGNGLSAEEIIVLATFLRSIGPDTPPIEQE